MNLKAYFAGARHYQLYIVLAENINDALMEMKMELKREDHNNIKIEEYPLNFYPLESFEAKEIGIDWIRTSWMHQHYEGETIFVPIDHLINEIQKPMVYKNYVIGGMSEEYENFEKQFRDGLPI